MSGLRTQPLGRFGTEVLGLDLRDQLHDTEVAELRALFAARHLLLVRGQEIDVDGQLRFAAHFGPLLDEGGAGTFHGWVSNTREDAAVKYNSRLPFHSDLGFTPTPYLGVCLDAIEIDGDMPTRFADTVFGCAALPPQLRRIAEAHTLTNAYCLAPGTYDDRRVRVQDVEPQDLGYYSFGEYPIVDRHPVSGEPYLRLSEMQTSYVNGITEAASEELIACISEHLYADDNVIEHSWQVGDVVIWDNVALQHGRAAFDRGAHRTLRRVTLGTMRAQEAMGSFDMSSRPAQAAI